MKKKVWHHLPFFGKYRHFFSKYPVFWANIQIFCSNVSQTLVSGFECEWWDKIHFVEQQELYQVVFAKSPVSHQKTSLDHIIIFYTKVLHHILGHIIILYHHIIIKFCSPKMEAWQWLDWVWQSALPLGGWGWRSWPSSGVKAQVIELKSIVKEHFSLDHFLYQLQLKLWWLKWNSLMLSLSLRIIDAILIRILIKSISFL